MKSSCFMIMFLLAVAMVSRSSLAARGSSSIPASVGLELRGFFAKAGGILSSAGRKGVEGWRATAGNDTKMKSSSKAKEGPRLAKASTSCIPAELCKKKKVICSKKCYKTRSSLNHIPTKCVVKCKKCVPSC